MNLLTKLLVRLWSMSPKLVSAIVKRSSTNNLVKNKSDLTPEELKEIENRWPAWRLALYAYLGFAVIRFWAAAVVFATGQFEELLQYDVLMNILKRAKVVNIYSVICFSPLTIFVIHFDWTVYVKRFNNIIRLCHEVMVVNPKDFLELNPQFKPDLSLKQEFSHFLRKHANIFLKLYNLRDGSIQWTVPTLKYLPYISQTIRGRALLLTWFFQLFISVFLIGTVLALLIGGGWYCSFFLLPNIPENSVSLTMNYFIGFTDVLLILFSVLHTIKLILFCTHLFISVEFVYHLYIADLEVLMQEALIRFKQRKLFEIKFTRLLTFYMGEIVTGLRRAISANEHLISPLFFSAAVSHFSLNLYLVGALYYQSKTLPLGDRVVFCSLITLQTLFVLVAVQGMIKLGRDLGRPGVLLGRVQMFLGDWANNRRWKGAVFLTTKLKVLSLYEQFHSKDSFRFTLGPLGAKITSKSVYEFVFIYSGSLIFIFNLIANLQKKTVD